MNTILNSVADRLQMLVEFGDSSARELSVLSGCAHSLLSGLFKGRWNGLNLRSAQRLAHTCGVSVGWILAGEGAMPDRKKVATAIQRARDRAQRERELNKSKRKQARQMVLQADRATFEALALERGIPAVADVRAVARQLTPDGVLISAVRATIEWLANQSPSTKHGSAAFALRVFTGAHRSGKTCALAWVTVTWPARALYRTARQVVGAKQDEFAALKAVELLTVDELGTEEDSTFIVELFALRARNGMLTIAATRLNADSFAERYFTGAGERLGDKLRRQRERGLPTFCNAVVGDRK